MSNKIPIAKRDAIIALETYATKDRNSDVISCFAILQCKPESDRSFLNYEKIKKHVDFNDYNFIARYGTTDETKNKPINEFLEDVFYTFNVNHPKDFKGHSLSVSDIVAIKIRNEVQFYFTDSVGFVHLPEDVILQ